MDNKKFKEMYHGDEEFRELYLEKQRIYYNDRYKTNPEFREKQKKKSRDAINKRNNTFKSLPDKVQQEMAIDYALDLLDKVEASDKRGNENMRIETVNDIPATRYSKQLTPESKALYDALTIMEVGKIIKTTPDSDGAIEVEKHYTRVWSVVAKANRELTRRNYKVYKRMNDTFVKRLE